MAAAVALPPAVVHTMDTMDGVDTAVETTLRTAFHTARR